MQAKSTAPTGQRLVAAACARQVHTPASRAARSLLAVPHMDAIRPQNRFMARNIACSAATATKEETYTYQAEVRAAITAVLFQQGLVQGFVCCITKMLKYTVSAVEVSLLLTWV